MENSKQATIDPIMMEIVGYTFISIAEEMSVTLQRTAYSSIVREAMDYSTAVFNEKGDLVAQSDNIPTHLGVMGKTLKRILKEYISVEDINEGDMIIINHPYMGASHTPDILLFSPIFSDNELVAFSSSMCHHADVGGSVAGSSPTNATELFHEGILLPPLKLYEKGKLNEAILSIIRANIRMPEYTIGDLNSQISSNKIGVRRVKELFEKYGNRDVKAIMNEWMTFSEMRIREKINELPDGEYTAEGHLDDDGVELGKKILMPVKVIIEGDIITFDFSDVAKQAQGPFNVTKETVWSVAYYITRCITDPNIPQNEGVFEPIKMNVKKGTILNPEYPAPVSGRHHTLMRLSDVCFQACSKIVPDKVPASSHAHASTIAIGGMHPDKDEYFVYYELNGGGMGARPTKDGLSGVDVYVGNCMNVPIEAAELEYPLEFQRYELITDSGGAGKYRGGLGIERKVKLLSDNLSVTIRNDAESTNPKGLFGGLDGKATEKYISQSSGSEERVNGKLTAKKLNSGDVLTIKMAGSGGYGSPKERNKDAIINDWKNGYISTDTLKNVYKVNPEKIQ